MENDEPQPWATRRDPDRSRVKAGRVRMTAFDRMLERGLSKLACDDHAARRDGERDQAESRETNRWCAPGRTSTVTQASTSAARAVSEATIR